MNVKLSLSIIAIILGLVYIPINYFIMYTVLKSIGPDRLVWFLFWGNLPILIIATILGEIIKGMKDKPDSTHY